jgi:hypothetical protein
MGGESGSGQLSDIMKPVMLYVLPGVFGLFLIFMPAVLQVSFFTAATLGMAQGYIFRQPGFRAKMGLLPIIPPGTAPPSPPNSKAALRATAAASGKSPAKLRILTPQPRYAPPTATAGAGARAPAAEADKLEKLGTLGAAWRDTKTSMETIWQRANEMTAVKSGAVKGSKRDKRELDRALSYEKRRKGEREREELGGRQWK